MDEIALFKDITILSLEQATVLPYLTLRLVQDGARVIRLEHPVYGDPNRLVGENVLGEDRMGSYYLAINAGKKCLTLDLATSAGQEVLKRLMLELPIDIFATNQLPRNYQKLGIDYESLSRLKPDLIWLGVTGFGPDSNDAAYDPILQARTGMMDLNGEKGKDPLVIGIPLPDMGASEHGYGLLMKALYRRAVTGKGTRVDLSMLESTASWLTQAITHTASFNWKVTRHGNTHEFFAPSGIFATKDGYVYMASGNDRQWDTLTKLPGFEKLQKKEYEKNAGRIKDVDNLTENLNRATRTYTTEALIQRFKEATLPIAKVHSVQDALLDPLLIRRLIKSKDPKTGLEITLAPPPFMTDYLKSTGQTLSFPPRFGEHNQEIYEDLLGYDKETVKGWRDQRVI